MSIFHVKEESMGGRRPGLSPVSTSPKRPPAGDRHPRGGSGQGSRRRGLRWVPVPLALLAALLGVLVVGSLQGQAAVEQAHSPYQAGGLGLSVDTMLWMMSSMNEGSAKAANPNGYQMPGSMMPGMQRSGDSRLRVEIDLRNVSTGVQWYSVADFHVVAPGGKQWKPYTSAENNVPQSAALEPGFHTTIDVYFDIAAKQATNSLSIAWSRDGTTVHIPVHTSGGMSGMRM
jgi:hypothetical protein